MKLLKIASEPFSVSLKALLKMPKVPAQTMFKLRGIAKQIAEETAKHGEIQSAIVEEFGERDEQGNLVRVAGGGIKVQKEKIPEMNVKLRDLATIEVNIPEIKFSDLGPEPTLTSDDLCQLEFIVE